MLQLCQQLRRTVRNRGFDIGTPQLLGQRWGWYLFSMADRRDFRRTRDHLAPIELDIDRLDGRHFAEGALTKTKACADRQ